MPALEFGLSSYERGRGDLPELPVINMFAEETPTEERGVVLQSRPEIADRSQDMGAGPVDCLFRRDLVLSGALFGVSAGYLYRDTTSLGAVDGSGPFSMAGYETALFLAGGGSLWLWDGTTLSAVSFPDGASVTKVIVGASRAICIREDTGKAYWSDSLETNIDALDFATAENQPDRLLDCLFIDDILILFGKETIEFWPNTGDPDSPFQPLEGRVIERGIRATGCAAAIGETFAWVTNANDEDGSGCHVCLGDEKTVISNPGLEARIAASTNCRLFRFFLEGSEFLALRLDNETQVYNRRSGLWSEFATYGKGNWVPQCYASGVFGSAVDGKTLAWGEGHEDALATNGVLERRFRAGFGSKAPVTVNNLRLVGNVGQAVELSGDYANPTVEMRISLNHGRTWSAWRQKQLGAQGAYETLVQWLALGMTRLGFGWLVEFRVTDPVDWRISSVLVNEGFGGR